MASNTFNILRRSLAFNSHPLRLYPIAQPRVPCSIAPPIRIAQLFTKSPLRTSGPTNHTSILAFARGLRSAFERTPIRRVVRPPQSPFGGGDGNGFVGQLKRRIDRMNPDHIFYAILGVNGLVFLMWGWAQENLQKFRDPEPLRFMFKHFTTSWNNVLEGRIWTLLTACFSHEMTGHLLVNGMSFWFMAPPVMQILGNSAFLALYLGGGIASSAFSLVWNAVVQHRGGNAHGASGAIYR
ncbi:Rhomboid protein, partial [Rhizoctonia solani]